MSSPELAYMSNTNNDDFDLPRWNNQTSHHHQHSLSQGMSTHVKQEYVKQEPLSSSQVAAAYLYPQPPPQAQQSPKPPRVGGGSSAAGVYEDPAYAMQGQEALGRRPSTNQASTPVRGRQQYQADDLEGAFTAPDAPPPSTQRAATNSYNYPPALAIGGPSTAGGNAFISSHPGSPAYGAGEYPPPPPRRSQQPQEAAPRSPAIIDHYGTPTQQSQQPQPGTYAPPHPSGAYPAYQSRNAQSQLSPDSVTSAGTAYSPSHHNGYSQQQTQSFAMDTSASPSHIGGAHGKLSISTPTTPLSYMHPSQSPYYGDHAMQVEQPPPPPRRRPSGFRKVKDHRDLRPYVNPAPETRRMDVSGSYLSPLRLLTTNILDTYRICNTQFRYESAHNPRRVLTKPSKPVHNDGYDNEDYDYILYVNDWLGTEEGHKYLILDILGQGTFGQVVKCQNMKTHEIVAVKVVKNKPAYFNQSMMEVTILEMLNTQHDPQDQHHILRLRDSFIHKAHLCLVFELLSSNLYELIKQNQFQGLSTQLVKVFTAQLLDAMTVLKDARLIHCDLKPENILLKSLQSPQIKVIDFGSACHERQTVYTYIQSRFYRSPEVLLGIPYHTAIDMWSLGCIAVELFLGLPLFPGTSEYNQITRIVEMLGLPPQHMMDQGKQTSQFFDAYTDMYGQKKWRLKSIEQYSHEHKTNEQPGKQYFKATTLPEIINSAPMPPFKSSSRQAAEVEREVNNRMSFIDFCQGLLHLDPLARWTPQQARQHPFITGEKFTKPFVPSGQTPSHPTPAPSAQPTPDPKRPYGGLVPNQQSKGSRPYQNAETYNQQLHQHQAYTTAQATQAANNTFRNPYIQQQQQQQAASQTAPSQAQGQMVYSHQPESSASAYAAQQQAQQSYSQQPQRTLNHQSSAGQLNQMNAGYGNAGGMGSLNPPASSYYTNTRARSNTINQVDNIPPALARLRHMNQDVIAGRNALTPVLNRDDAMQEWERRQTGKPVAAQPYPPELQYLHQQAELAAASGLSNWSQQQTPKRYPPPASKLSHSYHPTIIVDDDNRSAGMSSARTAPAAGGSSASMYAAQNPITSPPQAYSGSSGTRYANYPQQPASAGTFDTLDRRTDIGTMYVPMQPDQYQSYGASAPPQAAHAGGSRHVAQPSQSGFYGPAQQSSQPQQSQGNLYTSGPQQQQTPSSSNRQSTQMDIWPR